MLDTPVGVESNESDLEITKSKIEKMRKSNERILMTFFAFLIETDSRKNPVIRKYSIIVKRRYEKNLLPPKTSTKSCKKKLNDKIVIR